MARDHELEMTAASSGEVVIKVHYRDRVPDYLARFSEAVQRRARLMFWFKSPYERLMWKATRTMPWWARMTVRAHLLRERAEKIQARMDARAVKLKRKLARMEAHRQVVGPETGREGPGEGQTVDRREHDDGRLEKPRIQLPRGTDAHRVSESPPRLPAHPPSSRSNDDAQERPMPGDSDRADRVATGHPAIAEIRFTVPAGTPRVTGRRLIQTRAPLIGEVRQAAGSAWSAPTPPRLSITERLGQDQEPLRAVPFHILDRGRSR